MIQFDQALAIVCGSAGKMESEKVFLQEAYGRILDQDVFSDMDMPPFDKSAMDGFACRREDIEMNLKIIETIPAGYKPCKRIGKGECSRIMTGSVIPQGANCVVMFEHVSEADNHIRILKKSDRLNICFRGEDIRRGDKVLCSGTRIRAPQLAILASVGKDSFSVSKRPVVGIIATGSELVEPDQIPDGVQIRNSNSYQLWGQIQESGCMPRYLGIAPDDPQATDRILQQAMKISDVVLFSGGVSEGDYDFVPDILRKNGINLKFEKIAIRPGKPTIFGVKDNRYFFGLPGNPVSTFILFELLVKPFLFKLMGAVYAPKQVQAKIRKAVKRKKSDRTECIPVRFDLDGYVELIDYHGSAHISAYTSADGILVLSGCQTEIPRGQKVTVSLL